ncbi:MAG: flagellar biosynthetic protein FliO [Acidobacteriaceae bacterium]
MSERLRAWLRRLARPAAPDSPLRMEARVSLGAKKSLVLVRCCDRRVLLAVSGDTIAPVMEIPKAARRRGAGQ